MAVEILSARRVLHFARIVNRDDFIDIIVRKADAARFAMAACSPEGPSNIRDPGYAREGIPYFRISRPRLVLWSAALSLLWDAAHLRRILKAHGTEILHCHHYDGAIVGWLATRRRSQVRFVIGRHYSDAVYQLTTGTRRRAYLTLEALCNSSASLIVVPSTAAQEILVSQGVPPTKVIRIPYAFDFDSLSPACLGTGSAADEVWGAGPGIKIVTCGRLHVEKGHRYLLDAVARLCANGLRLRLAVVGDGPERARLEEQSLRLQLQEHVRFVGWRTDARELIGAADLVVQPTLHEAFSQVMVEAMALERPLVISDVSGVRDLVEDGISGWIVPPRDVDALFRAITTAADQNRARHVGRNARRRARRLLDFRVVLPRFEDAYGALVEHRERPRTRLA